MNVSYVDATFGGEQKRFYLGPKSLAAFELVAGSARALLGRLLGNHWTANEVQTLLMFAHPERFHAMGRVNEVVGKSPATYAGLAVTILVAALSGIDEASAVFDEADD